MAKHVMTAARRAALRKAQLASARKRRRKTAPRYKRTIGNVNREGQRKQKAALKKYPKGPGQIYKFNHDRLNLKGAYSKNSYGNPYKHKKLAKVAAHSILLNPGFSGVYAASYVRGRKAGTIKRKKR